MGCIIGDFKFIVNVTDDIAKVELQKRNIPVLSQHVIIFHVISTESILFCSLQKELHYSKSTLSDAINKYEELGFMKKVESNQDKRNVYVSLTPNGMKVYKELIEIDEIIKDLLFNNFNIQDRTQVEFGVHEILKNLK